MSADELRALADQHRKRADAIRVEGGRYAPAIPLNSRDEERAVWHDSTAAALDQAASDRATLERVRALPIARVVDAEPGNDLIRVNDLLAALRDEQEGGE